MVDIFSKNKRSEIMRSIKNKGNKSTELKLIKIFHKNEIKGWRRNYKFLGHPDFIFLKTKLAVFADGCFWHGHDCRNTKPSTNKEFWEKKITYNKLRDEKVNEKLKEKGWQVIRLWECEINKESGNEKITLIKKFLKC